MFAERPSRAKIHKCSDFTKHWLDLRLNFNFQKSWLGLRENFISSRPFSRRPFLTLKKKRIGIFLKCRVRCLVTKVFSNLLGFTSNGHRACPHPPNFRYNTVLTSKTQTKLRNRFSSRNRPISISENFDPQMKSLTCDPTSGLSKYWSRSSIETVDTVLENFRCHAFWKLYLLSD